MKKKRSLITAVIVLVFLLLSSAGPINQLPIFRAFFADNKLTLILSGLSSDQLQESSAVDVFLEQTPLEDLRITTLEKSDLPVNILFLVDTASTIYTNERELPAKIIDYFLNESLLTERGYFGIMTFSDTYSMVLQPTSDRNQVMEAIKGVDFNASGSYYSLAILNALYEIEKRSSGAPEKNQIILITDGSNFIAERISEEEIRKKLSAAGIALSAVVIRNSATGTYPSVDVERLSGIASASGGIAVTTENNGQPTEIGTRLMEPIRQSVVISGVIPSSFKPVYPDSAEMSVSFFNENEQIAGAAKTVRLPQQTAAVTKQPSPVSPRLTATATASPIMETGSPDVTSSPLPPTATQARIVPTGPAVSLVPIIVTTPTARNEIIPDTGDQPTPEPTNAGQEWRPLTMEEILALLDASPTPAQKLSEETSATTSVTETLSVSVQDISGQLAPVASVIPVMERIPTEAPSPQPTATPAVTSTRTNTPSATATPAVTETRSPTADSQIPSKFTPTSLMLGPSGPVSGQASTVSFIAPLSETPAPSLTAEVASRNTVLPITRTQTATQTLSGQSAQIPTLAQTPEAGTISRAASPTAGIMTSTAVETKPASVKTTSAPAQSSTPQTTPAAEQISPSETPGMIEALLSSTIQAILPAQEATPAAGLLPTETISLELPVRSPTPTDFPMTNTPKPTLGFYATSTPLGANAVTVPAWVQTPGTSSVSATGQESNNGFLRKILDLNTDCLYLVLLAALLFVIIIILILIFIAKRSKAKRAATGTDRTNTNSKEKNLS